MADIDPPSFSLGLDIDPSNYKHQSEAPNIPVSCSHPLQGEQEEHEPRVSDSDVDDAPPASFSLGLDLDPPNYKHQPQAPNIPVPSSHPLQGEEEELELRVSDSDVDDAPPPPRLKRLRRGASSCPPNKQLPQQLPDKADDDIEDFSSEDYHSREDEHPSTVHRSVCGSSKVPLHGNRVLNRNLGNQLNLEHGTPASSSTQGRNNKMVFEQPCISPLRLFKLLDSDSDSDDPDKVDFGKEGMRNNFVKQGENGHGCHASTSERNEPSTVHSQKVNLWESFYQEKASNVPTPALDEFCAEYYRTIQPKDSFVTKPVPESSFSKGKVSNKKVNSRTKKSQKPDPGDTLPPAHQYFSHKDSRIQRLVRSRLPHFIPLSASKNVGLQQDVSFIDYMGQFGNGEDQNRKKAKAKGPNLEGFSQASGSWVNPKHHESISKDAGKRRVRANVQSAAAGRWYTVNGQRVFVTKGGQELSGQSAYRRYKKEGRGGFKKTRKKTAAKKKK